jgi:hypothetical protein
MENIDSVMTIYTYIVVICFNLWQFGMYCGHLRYFLILEGCTPKNLATLEQPWTGPVR